jgi:tetratricopeptide (TPR) repeat protein
MRVIRWRNSATRRMPLAQLDPHDGLALVGLGGLRLREGDLAGARKAFERATIVGNNHADTLAFLARYVCAVLGRSDEALTLMQRSVTLNPNTPSWYYLQHKRVAYFAGRFELAPDQFALRTSDAAMRATPMHPQRLLRILASAQLAREVEMAAAVQELYAVDTELRAIEAEAVSLCPAARDLS